jgi:para-aminobenzoate synthetase component I
LSHLKIISLAYSDNLIAHYQALSDLDGFALLESSDKQRGRYDILSALPYDSLTITRDYSDIKGVWQQLQARLPQRPSKADLPFQGGAIGYFSYDFGAALLNIHSKPHPNNDMPLVNIGFYDWAIVVDHWKKKVDLVIANSQPDTALKMEEIQDYWHAPQTLSTSFQFKKKFNPLISEEAYKQSFQTIHQDLTCGRSYQVNYTQPFVADYSGNPWQLYKQIRSMNPMPYAAFLRTLEGDILSCSPERFLHVNQGIASTSPIKGTAPRSPDPMLDGQLRESLIKSAKNRAENVMIVDLLRNDLGKFAKPGSVQVTSLCEIQSFKEVHHLVSNIQAECMENITPLQAFAACFPGGSITGAPKQEAMRIIAEQEPFARGVYCGSIAYLSAHGRLDSNIAIRTIIAKQNSMYLPAGGGIVIDSNWEDEYRECFTKIAAIVNE